MDPNARRPPLPDSWLAPRRERPVWRDVVTSVVLGWLVLMTVWGFGRSAVPEHATWFLVAGAVAGLVAAGAGVRRARRRRLSGSHATRRRAP